MKKKNSNNYNLKIPDPVQQAKNTYIEHGKEYKTHANLVRHRYGYLEEV